MEKNSKSIDFKTRTKLRSLTSNRNKGVKLQILRQSEESVAKIRAQWMSLWYWVSVINFDKEVRKKKNFSGSDKMFTDDKATKELQNKYFFKK